MAIQVSNHQKMLVGQIYDGVFQIWDGSKQSNYMPI